MSNLRNLKQAINNTISAATSIVAVTCEVAADATQLVAISIAEVPKVAVAIKDLPKAATKGYIEEDQGISSEAAQEAAEAIFNKSLSDVVILTGEAAGLGFALLLADDEDDADKLVREAKELAES